MIIRHIIVHYNCTLVTQWMDPFPLAGSFGVKRSYQSIQYQSIQIFCIIQDVMTYKDTPLHI